MSISLIIVIIENNTNFELNKSGLITIVACHIVHTLILHYT